MASLEKSGNLDFPQQILSRKNLITIKLRVLMHVYGMELNFLPKGHIVNIHPIPSQRQSEIASMCFETRRASTRDGTSLNSNFVLANLKLELKYLFIISFANL
jgi:hypothetical protein